MKPDKVAERVNALITVSDKSQKQIADELGYDRPNIITMFKTGATKVPLSKVGPLATALNANPAHMVRLALETYAPETYEAIQGYLGELCSPNEIEILKAIRKASGDTDPKLDSAKREAIMKLFKA